MFSLGKIVQLLRDILDVCRLILKVLRLRQPGPVVLQVVSEEGTMLKFKIVLPPPGAPDVVSRNLSLKIGDAESQSIVLAGTDLETAEFVGAEGSIVSGQLADVDDASNISPARDFSFTLLDTIAPPMPGELGLMVTDEVFEEPTPDPEPEPEPDPSDEDTTDL